jgi:hypothetical protein
VRGSGKSKLSEEEKQWVENRVSIPVRGSGKSKTLTPEALWNQGYK